MNWCEHSLRPRASFAAPCWAIPLPRSSYVPVLVQYAPRLTYFTKVISGLHCYCQRARQVWIALPIFNAPQYGNNSSVGLVKLDLEVVPLLRGYLFNGTPDFAPIRFRGVICDEVPFKHFEINSVVLLKGLVKHLHEFMAKLG